MKIDRNLNLVIPVEIEPAEINEKGDVTRPAQNFYVHSSPVAIEVFEENAFLFARAFNEALKAGQNMGPRIAALILKEQALIVYGENSERYTSLMAEIRRLTMVIIPTERGYDPIPLEEAIRTKKLDREDASQVENAIVFFTLSWRILLKADRETMTRGAVMLWGGLTTSSNSTDYARSLTTSTQAENTGARPAAASSVPS